MSKINYLGKYFATAAFVAGLFVSSSLLAMEPEENQGGAVKTSMKSKIVETGGPTEILTPVPLVQISDIQSFLTTEAARVLRHSARTCLGAAKWEDIDKDYPNKVDITPICFNTHVFHEYYMGKICQPDLSAQLTLDALNFMRYGVEPTSDYYIKGAFIGWGVIKGENAFDGLEKVLEGKGYSKKLINEEFDK